MHVRDIVQLPEKQPQLYAKFFRGNFGVQMSAHKFSLICKDHSLNNHTKTRSTVVGGGLYENLFLYMLAGPNYCRCIEKFQAVLDTTSSCTAAFDEEAGSLHTT